MNSQGYLSISPGIGDSQAQGYQRDPRLGEISQFQHKLILVPVHSSVKISTSTSAESCFIGSRPFAYINLDQDELEGCQKIGSNLPESV